MQKLTDTLWEHRKHMIRRDHGGYVISGSDAILLNVYKTLKDAVAAINKVEDGTNTVEPRIIGTLEYDEESGEMKLLYTLEPAAKLPGEVEEIHPGNQTSILRQYCHCEIVDASLRGYPTEDGGFIITKGSVISSKAVPSFEIAGKYYYRLRQQLLSDGTIKDRVFQQDYKFSSPTGAAAVCLGRTISGRAAWKEITTNG